MGHGVACIETEVEHQLINLRGVSHHAPQVIGDLSVDQDVLGKGFLSHLDHVPHQMPGLNGNPFT